MISRWVLPGISLGLAFMRAASADTLTLSQALSRALSSSPEIKAQVSRSDAERSAIRSSYSPDNPSFGLMHEANMSFMEQQMGPMNIWSVSQAIKFPTKYFLMGSAQRAKAKAADQELSAKKLEVRQKLVSAYYNLFAVDRVIALLEAQRETLREVARSAESRHAVGAVPQQDEMKAHTEQTRIETDLLSAEEEQSMAQANLNALMNRDANEELRLPQGELEVPALKADPSGIEKIAFENSREIHAARDRAESAGLAKNLAAWSYAPDFQLSYQRAYSNSPPDAYSASIEMSFPLWFFGKQTGDYDAAASRSTAAERSLDLQRLKTSAEVKSLISKVVAHVKLLEIYETSLIPQASTTLRSSQGAYQAGRTGFLEMLDSERSLYAVRIAYYRTLSQYVDDLTHLEEVAGASLSSLPMGGAL